MLNFIKSKGLQLIKYVELKGKTNREFDLTLKCKCGSEHMLKYPYIKKIENLSCDACRKKDRDNGRFELLLEKAKEIGITILSKSYSDCYDELDVICKCGNNFKTTGINIATMVKVKCEQCTKSSYKEKRSYKKEDILDIMKQHDIASQYISHRIEKNRIKIIMRCCCGNKYTADITNIKRGNYKSCKICSTEIRNRKRSHSFEYIKDDLLKNNNLKIISDSYKNSTSLITVECKCGNTFSNYYKNLRALKIKCCKECSSVTSRPELETINMLNKYNIKYISQKTFPGCEYKKLLRFDFYLPDHNVAIEVNGRQHYEAVEFFGGLDSFEKSKIRDSIKRAYCKNKKINLIEIPYWDFDKIESYIVKYKI